MQIDFSAAFDSVNDQGILYKLCFIILVVLSCLYWHCFYQIYHSTLWRMVVGVNWFTVVRSAAVQCFVPVIVPPVHLGAIFYSGEQADRLCRRLHFDICCAILSPSPSPSRHSTTESLTSARLASGVTIVG